ncbi:MAG TPA: hypothetical protein VG457_16535 [Planctomycetota bacterium]|jgi:hypothetical protein|nr:hypothetical protein [Planctomycetota bacterium]
MDTQGVGFRAQEKTLISPPPEYVEEAFRSLSPQGTLTIQCRPTEVSALLATAERAGFRGMRVDRTEGLKILAHKTGPQGAGYSGPAAAALDDEGRLMLNGADPDPRGRDQFLADAKRLVAWLGLPAGTKDRVVVFYPGPFRTLILKDGSIVRRGHPVRLPAEQAKELEKSEGAWVNPKIWSAATDPRNYGALYRERGAICLLEGDRPAELDALDGMTEAMKRRLSTVIDRGEDYFVLTGSDPNLKDGCCPSNEVGEANVLVQGGVLSSSVDSANADCPATIYAFGAEIRKLGEKPSFVRNEPLRAAVKDRILRGPRMSRKLLIRLALMAIGAAALAVLTVTLFRQLRGR